MFRVSSDFKLLNVLPNPELMYIITIFWLSWKKCLAALQSTWAQVVGNALGLFNHGRRKGLPPSCHSLQSGTKSQHHSGKIKEAPRGQKETKSVLSHICFMGIYKRLRQLLPKFELMSQENHFRKCEFLSSNFLGPSHSGMNRIEPSSFTGNICVGRSRGDGEHNEEPIWHWTLIPLSFFPASLGTSICLAVWEGKSIKCLWLFQFIDTTCKTGHLEKELPWDMHSLWMFVFQKLHRVVGRWLCDFCFLVVSSPPKWLKKKIKKV